MVSIGEIVSANAQLSVKFSLISEREAVSQPEEEGERPSTSGRCGHREW